MNVKIVTLIDDSPCAQCLMMRLNSSGYKTTLRIVVDKREADVYARTHSKTDKVVVMNMSLIVINSNIVNLIPYGMSVNKNCESVLAAHAIVLK